MKYIITEKQNVNSVMDGYEANVDSLSSAKRAASRNQVFEGTVLTIEHPNGDLISYKKSGKWFDMFDHAPKSFKNQKNNKG